MIFIIKILKKNIIFLFLIFIFLISSFYLYNIYIYKKEISNFKNNEITLSKKITELNNIIQDSKTKKKFLEKNIKKFIFEKKNKKLNFNYIETKNFQKEYNINFYKNDFISLLSDRSFIEYNKDNLYIIDSYGNFYYSKLHLNSKFDIIFNEILSNIDKFIINDFIKIKQGSVRDLLINETDVYVSYIKLDQGCYRNSVISANLNNISNNKLYFEEIFLSSYCSKQYSLHSGGVIDFYDNENLIIAIGDWDTVNLAETRKYKYPQNLNNQLGKIIKFNINSNEYSILSIGHSNPQGLYYDKQNKTVYNTEHGPQGGDEININNLNTNRIKNFGWPESSYGEHYGYPNNLVDSTLYDNAPLKKSHSEYGFDEPLIYFVPSLSPTQLVKSSKNKSETLFMSTIGYDLDEGDKSIHEFKLTNGSIIEHKIIPINDRIRDLILIKDEDTLVFYSQNGTLGIFKLPD